MARIWAFENFTGLGKWTAQLGHRGIWPLDNPCDDKYALITGTERLLLLLFCFQIQILVCLDQPNGERNNLLFEPHHYLSNIKLKIWSNFCVLGQTVKYTDAKIITKNKQKSLFGLVSITVSWTIHCQESKPKTSFENSIVVLTRLNFFLTNIWTHIAWLGTGQTTNISAEK